MLKVIGILLASALLFACSNTDGDDALAQGIFVQAVSEFNVRLAEDPQDAEAHLGLGHAQLGLGQFEMAIASYSAAIEFAQDDPQLASAALASRGWAYRFLADYEKAFTDYDAALMLDDQSWLAHYNRAQTNLALERYQDAIDDFTRAIQIDPDEGRAYFFRGEAYYRVDMYTEGDADFDTACDLGFSLYVSDCSS